MLAPSLARSQGGYVNERFRFSARVPHSLTACPHIPPAPDSGFIMPLSGQGCEGPLGGEYLAVAGWYNVPDHRNTQQAARDVCGDAMAHPARAHRRIRFRRCDRHDEDGFALVHYITLRLDPTPVWSLHGYVIVSSLRCRPANCARYEPLLRNVVASIRFR